MSARRRVILLWALLAGLTLSFALPLAGPLYRAWACYRIHLNGERASAELVHKLEPETLVLSLATGPQAGDACTAKTSRAHYAASEPGETLDVVYLEERPGECVLVSTIANSGLVLWLISGTLLFLLALIAALGLWLQRSFTRPGVPLRRMPVDPHAVRCPACDVEMEEGYVPLLAGVHWRELGEPVGLPHALGGLSGTVGWRGRPLLHAFRCAPCEILSLQYGTPPAAGGRGPARL